MNKNTIYFNMRESGDMGHFSALVSFLKYHGVKIMIERDGDLIALTIM